MCSSDYRSTSQVRLGKILGEEGIPRWSKYKPHSPELEAWRGEHDPAHVAQHHAEAQDHERHRLSVWGGLDRRPCHCASQGVASELGVGHINGTVW